MQAELSLLLSKGIPESCKKKEFLIRKGETSDKVYFIREGVTRHFLSTAEGDEKTIRLSTEGDFFYSSIVSFFRAEPSYIYCQCLTYCEFLFWRKNDLERLFASDEKLAEFRNQQHVNFILQKHKKEIALLTKNAEERYSQFCEEKRSLFNRIPHHIIASYLDITPETLSRLRSRKS